MGGGRQSCKPVEPALCPPHAHQCIHHTLRPDVHFARSIHCIHTRASTIAPAGQRVHGGLT